MNRYCIERRKRGASAFYLMRVVDAPLLSDALSEVQGDFSEGDEVRGTLMSVEVVAKRDATAAHGWTVLSSGIDKV